MTSADATISGALICRPNPDRNVSSGSQPPRMTGTINARGNHAAARVGAEEDDYGGEQEHDDEEQRSERRAWFLDAPPAFLRPSPPSPSGCNRRLTMLSFASAR